MHHCTGKTILFVDDNEAVITPLAEMLIAQGYRVVAMTSSTEALQAFSRQPDRFDLVLTDNTMPGLSGQAMAGHMLRLRPDIPIILYTGNAADVDPATIARSGIRAFLMKPISIAELTATIEKVLDPIGGGVA